MCEDNNHWYRRQAQQIASQLPDNPEAAWEILGMVVQMQALFFGPPPAPAIETDQAVLLRLVPAGPTSPKRRASSKGNPSGLPK